MEHPNITSNCDADVTKTNLVLAQLLLKTTDETTKLIENPPLLSIIQSLCNTSELYFSRSSPLQSKPSSNVYSRANYDSTSTHDDLSLSLPSSVHVADVTHDKCHAYEHTASHGVSETANETNVNCNIILDDIEGVSMDSASLTLSRKRPSVLSPPPSKRVSQEHPGTPSYNKAISSVSELLTYIEESNIWNKTVDEAHKRIKDLIPGMYTTIYIMCQISLIIIIFNLRHFRSLPVCEWPH